MTTTDVQNGRSKGRAVPLPQFTFPDSGVTVGLRRIAPDTQNQIVQALLREHPEPQPPMFEHDYGSGKIQEPNRSDPDYVKSLSDYWNEINTEAGTRLVQFAIRRIVVDVDTEAVQQLRDDMVAIGAPIEEEDDRVVYIRHICISSLHDLHTLMAYLQRRSLPTEAAVQEHTRSFRDNVQET